MEHIMTNLSRRGFVQALCAAGVATPLAAACQTMASGPFFQQKAAPIGIQLYTLSDMLATNLEGAVSNVARIGYKTVEIPSYMGKTPAQLRELFDRNGVKCTGAHIGMNAGTDAAPGLRGNLDKLAADMHVLGVSMRRRWRSPPISASRSSRTKATPISRGLPKRWERIAGSALPQS